jgi:hypothetical protein
MRSARLLPQADVNTAKNRDADWVLRFLLCVYGIALWLRARG